MEPTNRKWLLAFEDTDCGICLYDDEVEARNAYAAALLNWNCQLFVPVEEFDRRLAEKKENSI